MGANCGSVELKASDATQEDPEIQEDLIETKNPNLGRIGLIYTSEPYTTSEHHRTKQENDADASVWIRCSHSIYSNPIAISDHEIIVFPEGRDISIFYTYDSNTDNFCKWGALTASSNSGEAILAHSRIITFNLNTNKWHKISHNVHVPKGYANELCLTVIGSVIIDGEFWVLCNHWHFTWDIVKNDFNQQRIPWRNKMNDTDYIINNMNDINVFYKKRAKEIWFKNASNLYKYDIMTNTMSLIKLTINKAPDLRRFGCLMTFDERYIIIFGNEIYFIDTVKRIMTKSKIERPRSGKTFYACLMGNDDTISLVTEGYIRSHWKGDNWKEYDGIRYPSLDVIRTIKSFYGTWYIHLFGRNGGYHWAMRPDPILDV